MENPELFCPASFSFPSPSPHVIDRAHRLPGHSQQGQSSILRVLIVKFLNIQEKSVMRTARIKGEIMYGDLSAELHRQRQRLTGLNNGWDPWTSIMELSTQQASPENWWADPWIWGPGWCRKVYTRNTKCRWSGENLKCLLSDFESKQEVTGIHILTF